MKLLRRFAFVLVLAFVVLKAESLSAFGAWDFCKDYDSYGNCTFSFPDINAYAFTNSETCADDLPEFWADASDACDNYCSYNQGR